MKLKKWLCGLLAAAMMMATMTGCLGHVFTKAATVEGEDIPAGTYLMMQFIAYSEAANEVEDVEGDILTQEIEGEKGIDWVNRRTDELVREYVVVNKLAAENNVTLSEESTAAVEQNLSYWPMMEEYYVANGIGENTINTYLQNLFIKQDLFDFYYGEGGPKAPTREEIETQYGEENAHVRGFEIALSPDGMTVLQDDSAVRSAIDDMMAEIEAGKTLDEAAAEDLPVIQQMIEDAIAAENGLAPEEGEGEPTEGEDEPTEGEGTPEDATSTPEDATSTPEDATSTPEDANTEGDVPEEEEPAEGEEPTEGEEPEEGTSIQTKYISYEDMSGSYTEAFLTTLKEQEVGDVGSYEYQNIVLVYEKVPTFTDDAQYEETRDTVVQEMKQDEFEDFLKETGAAYTVNYVAGARWYLSPKKIVVS